eukprot:4245771-Pleurochrysis_carterae.AAC.1
MPITILQKALHEISACSMRRSVDKVGRVAIQDEKLTSIAKALVEASFKASATAQVTPNLVAI